jgi:hypothetical protein
MLSVRKGRWLKFLVRTRVFTAALRMREKEAAQRKIIAASYLYLHGSLHPARS